MGSVGPEAFKRDYGEDFARLKTSGAARIYEYFHQYGDRVYWLGYGRYDVLHEGDVNAPLLLWIDPVLEEELLHPDEQLILGLDYFLHNVSRLASELYEGGNPPIDKYGSLAKIVEECRTWVHKIRHALSMRSQSLGAHTQQLDELLQRLLGANPPIGKFFSAKLYAMNGVLGDTLKDSIALRHEVRDGVRSSPVFASVLERMDDQNANSVATTIIHQQYIEGLHMGDKTIIGQAGVVGDYAKVGDITQVQHIWHANQVDFPFAVLTSELSALRIEMRKEAKESSHDKAVVAVGEAEEAARKSDGPTLVEHLRKAGAWALEIAKKVCLNVATKAIEKSMGI